MFWRDSKFAEMEPQLPPERHQAEDIMDDPKATRKKASHLVVASVPSFAFEDLASLYAKLMRPAAQESTFTMSYAVRTGSPTKSMAALPVTITYEIAGLLLMLKEASVGRCTRAHSCRILKLTAVRERPHAIGNLDAPCIVANAYRWQRHHLTNWHMLAFAPARNAKF